MLSSEWLADPGCSLNIRKQRLRSIFRRLLTNASNGRDGNLSTGVAGRVFKTVAHICCRPLGDEIEPSRRFPTQPAPLNDGAAGAGQPFAFKELSVARLNLQ
ncbi:MAG: hypothetical protein ACR2G4_03975 [Pyrinomonadaceae bacterium]